MLFRVLLAITIIAVAMTGHSTAQEDPLRVLYVTKSEGFEHGPVAEIDGQPSHSQKIFDDLAAQHGWEVTTTKDAALVNAENLANYDVVMFYTQGDITQMGTKDQGEPMAPEGLRELLTWIENGGGFIAIHAGTDSFRTGDAHTPSDYIAMVGGEFRTHGPQFVGTLKVVSPDHPVAAGQPETWTVNEEWYLWRHLNASNMHVVATIDPGRARRSLEDYDLPDYPMVWVSSHGKGRVYVNGMGHREDVWDHEYFQNWLVNGIHWAAGQGETMTTPNYHEHISADIDPRTGALTEEAKAQKEPRERERLPRRERAPRE